jgi:hypothetical protein
MALKDTLNGSTPIQYYTEADPYFYTVDNRPLQNLKSWLDAICDRIDLMDLGRVDVNGTTAGSFNPSTDVYTQPSGWSVARNSAGTFTITHNLSSSSYSVIGSAVGATPSFVSVVSIGADSFQVKIAQYDGTLVDLRFSVVLTRL